MPMCVQEANGIRTAIVWVCASKSVNDNLLFTTIVNNIMGIQTLLKTKHIRCMGQIMCIEILAFWGTELRICLFYDSKLTCFSQAFVIIFSVDCASFIHISCFMCEIFIRCIHIYVASTPVFFTNLFYSCNM